MNVYLYKIFAEMRFQTVLMEMHIIAAPDEATAKSLMGYAASWEIELLGETIRETEPSFLFSQSFALPDDYL